MNVVGIIVYKGRFIYSVGGSSFYRDRIFLILVICIMVF